MRIILISLDNWGLNKYIATNLEKNGHIVHHIDFNTFKFKYKSLFHKAYNFILKSFFRKNLKHIYYGKEILKEINKINKRRTKKKKKKGAQSAPSRRIGNKIIMNL